LPAILASRITSTTIVIASAIKYDNSVPTERVLGTIIGGTAANARITVAAPAPLKSALFDTARPPELNHSSPPKAANSMAIAILSKDDEFLAR
jgi:hypothetical protein